MLFTLAFPKARCECYFVVVVVLLLYDDLNRFYINPLSCYQLERFSWHFDNLYCSELSNHLDDLRKNRGRILRRSTPSKLKILAIHGHDLSDISTAKVHQNNSTDSRSNFIYMDGREHSKNSNSTRANFYDITVGLLNVMYTYTWTSP